MTIQKITLECPACGAGLEVGADREFCICPYCDTKIMLHNENEHIYRNIDEAGMMQAETGNLNWKHRRRNWIISRLRQ